MQRHGNSAYWDNTLAEAQKGISMPKQIVIPTGTVLYRFIDINRGPSARGADGPWWMEYEYYQRIKQFSEQHGYPLGYAARMFAAVLYEWSGVNAVVKARVKDGPLLAWKGRGKQVQATGKDPRDVAVQHGWLTSKTPTVSARMTPMQGPLEILQLYVPGLGRPHNKFAVLMDLIDSQQIRTG
jgi:hypothetical protein